jgi:peptide/nickel transport system substrate-binding protein
VNRTRQSAAVIAVVLAAAMVLVACGKSAGTKLSSPAETANSASKNDINLTPRDQVKDGGDLRWVIDNLPVNYNANELDGTDVATANVMSALMPAPFDFDPAGQPVLKTAYVTSAKLTATTPKQVVTYELNPKAVWSDGSQITEADYEAQWKALSGADQNFQVAATNGYDQVESVKAGKDDHEVIVTFKNPYSDWQAMFSLLYPAATNKSADTFNKGWLDKPLVTAGPFKFQSVDSTAKTIIVVRNDKWWGNTPKLARIIFRAIDVDAQIDALANGEIDFIDVGPDVNKLKRAESTNGISVRKAGGPNFRHITINGTGPILSDVNVRHALGLAINRDTIAKALIGPLGVTAKELNNHIYMANQKGYKNNAGDMATADPAKAKTMLDAAGWTLPSGGSVRTKDGKPLELRMVIPSQVSTSQQESELIQGMLAQVGIKLDIQVVPSDDFFDKYITPGNFDLTVFSWIGTPFPISSNKSIYAKPTQGKDGLDIQQNYARIGSDQLDALFDKATAETDPAKAIDLGNQIDAMIWQEVHSLTDYQRPDIVATKSTLANYGALGFATAIYEDIGFKK